jgi:asparaginyl-tRNA synthetase
MTRELIKYILKSEDVNKPVVISGWVRTRRDSKGGFSFLEVNDGSCLDNIQIIANATLCNYEAAVKKLHPGASVTVTGILVKSEGGKQRVEVVADQIEVCGFCEPTDYPLQKSRVALEKLRQVAHLRPRTKAIGAVMRVRNALAFATHQFFQEQDFLYVNTPIITANDCEGAGEMFQVTTLDVGKVDKKQVDYAQDFFAKQTSLTVSGQLEGEAYACALSNIYTFGPTFRAENSNTSRHLAEFWMIEPEIAFADLKMISDVAEAYVKYIFKYVLTHCADEVELFNKFIDKTLLEKLNNVVDNDFVRISYTEAIDILLASNKKFEYPVSWGCDLQSEHERFLAEEHFKAPVILSDYPKEIKAFYMRVNDDGKTVAAIDVLFPGVGEMIGGAQREERYDVLKQRMLESGLDPEAYWWYLDLRRFGTVPHGGFGLGFERAVQFCTGMTNIRDVIPFPRSVKHCEF